MPRLLTIMRRSIACSNRPREGCKKTFVFKPNRESKGRKVVLLSEHTDEANIHAGAGPSRLDAYFRLPMNWKITSRLCGLRRCSIK